MKRTTWGEQLSVEAPLPEYPRPQLERGDWVSLNGRWECAFTPFSHDDPLAVADPTVPPREGFGEIVVPFSPEVPLSGVGRTLQPDETLWYRRHLVLPRSLRPGERVLLHFGAVDQSCRVAVDGVDLGGHTGGWLPFVFDVTAALASQGDDGEHEVVVAVRDVTDASWLTRGKQSRRRGGIWYSPQSGIWQTVWLEIVPAVSVARCDVVPHLADSEVEVTVTARTADGISAEMASTARVELSAAGDVVASADVVVGVPTRVAVPRPVRAWSPEDPFLYDVAVVLGDDRVRSYVGMRSFGVGVDDRGHPRLLLNGEPYLPVGLLDQGYWPDGGLTAPADAALEYDIVLAKQLGYTMLRKHIKVEPLRWYHHCDRLGMIVWQDAVNGGGAYGPAVFGPPAYVGSFLKDRRHRWFGRSDATGRASFERELAEMIAHLRGVPSIGLWVPFNEGWGQFDARRIAERVRELDPTRPVDHASGWHDQGAGDLRSLHIYFRAFRVPRGADARVLALTEYGGYSLAVPGHTWGDRVFGYRRYRSRAALQRGFERLHDEQIAPAVARGLGATVYTQLSDVEDEVNGLVTYDRRIVKIPVEAVRAVNDRLRAASRGDRPTRSGSSARMPMPASPAVPVSTRERELTAPVALVLPDGRLNTDAIGFARTPIVDTSGIGGRHRWGRNKRWEYWNVMTPTHIVALTVSSIDYAAVHEVWVFDRATLRSWSRGATVVPAREVSLPGSLGGAVAHARADELSITVTPFDGGRRWRLQAEIPGAAFDITVVRPPGHDALAVVVPWSRRVFQYTVKDVALPASGTITIEGTDHDVPAGSWAVLDHGRGRWPYDVAWNWGAASGVLADGRSIGIQVGGRWTDGTGSTENGVIVDGVLHKISVPVAWQYDLTDVMRPWRLRGGGLDATFTPFYNKQSRANLGVVSSRTDQCFGTWSGTFTVTDAAHGATASTIAFDGIEGFAEDVHNRW